MIYPNEINSYENLSNKEVLLKLQFDFIIGINQKNFLIDNPHLKFFVKLKGRKYADCVWISKSQLESNPNFDNQLINSFQISLKDSKLSPVPFISCLYKPNNIILEESFFYPEEILASKKESTEILYYIKWQNLGVDQATWENNSDNCIPPELISNYEFSIDHPNPVDSQSFENFQNPSQFIPLSESPIYKNDNRLTSYQLNGLNWLIDKWYYNQNSFLADESEVGKKVQIVAFTEEIYKMTGFSGPSLVITTLEHVNSWLSEFKKWTEFRVIEYIGSEKQLKIIYDFALFTDESKKFMKYDVIITTYEIFNSHFSEFKVIQWICIYIDDLIPQIIHDLHFESLEKIAGHMIILTTKDIASFSINDLYSLFHLLENDTFSDLELFLQDYSSQNSTHADPEKFDSLSQIYILRRGKEMIDPILIRMNSKSSFLNDNDIIIEAEPTQFQIEIFKKHFLEQRSDFIFNENLLHNLFLLRKIANHPFLDKYEFLKFQKEEKTKENELKMFIEASGKMIVLDKLLTRFLEQDEKILILTNMSEMVNLIEFYLSKKKVAYKRIGNSCRTMMISQDKTPIYLSTINDFSMHLNETENILIYDGHFTPPSISEKKNIYRLFTHGTVEEDLFIKFTVKKDFTSPTKESVNSLMRRNAYFAFYGQIDRSFLTEPIEKTLEYRTDLKFVTDESLKDPEFWINLYKKQDLKVVGQIPIENDQLKLISNLVLNVGCFEAQDRYQKEHNVKNNFNYLLALLMYCLYKSIEKERRIVFKNYIQKVRKLSKEIIVSRYIIDREPFTNHSFIRELFGDNLFLSMMKIFSLDRIYICLSFMSQIEFNQIGFIFAKSMNCPVYWNDFYDYTLMYTSLMYGSTQSNVKMFQANLENINISVGNLPSSTSYVFTSVAPDLSSSSTQPNSSSTAKTDSGIVNLPNSVWLKQRITLIIAEMETVIPVNYFPSIHPMKPSQWVNFYNPNSSIHLESRNMIRRVLRFLFLFGLPTKNHLNQISILKKKMNLNSIPDEIISSIIFSLIKSAADLVNSYPENLNLSLDDTQFTSFKSDEIRRSTHDLLISLIRNIKPIRIIDVSWVRKDALFLLVKQLIFFIHVRDLFDAIKTNKINYIGHLKWNGAPEWWDHSCDIELINSVASFGFVFLSILKNLDKISSKLTQNDKIEIDNFRIYEKKMLCDPRIDLPQSLKELSFLRKIENRVFILQNLYSILMVPTIKMLSNYLAPNQMTGLIVINFGNKNENGYPIGYKSIRFYRSIHKSSDHSNQIIPANDKDENCDDFCSFYCFVSECENYPIFIIRNQDNNIKRFFEIRAFSIKEIYMLLIDTLLKKGIDLPPPYFDGYGFFGFRNNFVGSFISSAP